jgi:hypothetical protein
LLVYKFLTAAYALEDLTKRRMKISTFSDINDPFELAGAKSSDPAVQDFLTRHIHQKYGALCFSRKWSNPMLWSHYSDKHKGICLGFEIVGDLEEPKYVDVPTRFDALILFDATPAYSDPSAPEFNADVTHGEAMAGYAEIDLAIGGRLHGGDESGAGGGRGDSGLFRENSIQCQCVQGKAPRLSGSHDPGFILRLNRQSDGHGTPLHHYGLIFSWSMATTSAACANALRPPPTVFSNTPPGHLCPYR